MAKSTRAMSDITNSNADHVKELLNTRLNSLNEKIDGNNTHVVELLNLIKEQTTKTNGKVMTLDKELRTLTSEYQQHLINSANIIHIKDLQDRIDKINEENFIVKVWNRYPKQLMSIIVITMLLTLATFGYTMINVHNALNKFKAESTQIDK